MISHLTCWLCGKRYPCDRLVNTCSCGRPLRVDHKLDADTLPREALKDREPNMWRYKELLPQCEPITLGEGMTPLQHAPKLGERWYVKDEGLNPTASFKARGMSAAVSMARHFGVERLAVPTAGNAGGAMAAYAAKAGMEANVFMPLDTPAASIIECDALGAKVTLIDGLITDCGTAVKEFICASENGDSKVFDMSTLKEPYRAEGKKTMGYEIAEQLGWRLPDVIIYPTGGGTGLIGMWKAFDEMERMGWIGPERPRMICVQADDCAPIVTAFDHGQRFADEFPNAKTIASGLRVPRAIGDFIMLDIISDSGGAGMTVSDENMVASAKEMAVKTGIFAAPEGGATLAAAREMEAEVLLKPNELVLLFNTGSGLKYLEALGGMSERPGKVSSVKR